MVVVRKKQLFGAICTWFEFIIGHMTSMLNFSLLGQALEFLLLKHYYVDICIKKLIKWVYQKYLLITSCKIILLPHIVYAYILTKLRSRAFKQA